jgi:hypothetical protein
MINTSILEGILNDGSAAVSFAGTMALAVNATRPEGAYIATSAAVAGVIHKVEAKTAAICRARRAIAARSLDAGWGRSAADVSAGAAVLRIRIHRAASPVATGRTRSATGKGSAGSAEAASVAVARLAGGQALILLSLVRTRAAKGFAPVGTGRPRGPQSPGGEYRAGDKRSDRPQGFAARDRLGQQLGKFIETFHD